ncbi:hypothetical protein T265_00776, partial [Opisthorchis viverrini]
CHIGHRVVPSAGSPYLLHTAGRAQHLGLMTPFVMHRFCVQHLLVTWCRHLQESPNQSSSLDTHSIWPRSMRNFLILFARQTSLLS